MALHKTMDNFIVPTFVWERCQKYACVSYNVSFKQSTAVFKTVQFSSWGRGFS